jgi:phage gpG-like protein
MPSSSSKTRKMNRGGTPTGECEKKYCKKFVSYAVKFSDNLLKSLENVPNKTEIQKKLIKMMKSKKFKNTLTKKALKECKSKYCNVGCKDTIFEDGKELPKSMMTEFKDNPALIDLLFKAKKDLFGTQTTILKDNFYNKLKPSTINVMKKEGAISGCVKIQPNNF